MKPEQALKSNPAEECPHFESCAVNLCPLDKGYNQLTFSPTDKEINCRLRRGIRRKIARKYALPIITIRKRKSREIKGNKNNKQGSEVPNSAEERLKPYLEQTKLQLQNDKPKQ